MKNKNKRSLLLFLLDWIISILVRCAVNPAGKPQERRDIITQLLTGPNKSSSATLKHGRALPHSPLSRHRNKVPGELTNRTVFIHKNCNNTSKPDWENSIIENSLYPHVPNTVFPYFLLVLNSTAFANQATAVTHDPCVWFPEYFFSVPVFTTDSGYIPNLFKTVYYRNSAWYYFFLSECHSERICECGTGSLLLHFAPFMCMCKLNMTGRWRCLNTIKLVYKLTKSFTGWNHKLNIYVCIHVLFL